MRDIAAVVVIVVGIIMWGNHSDMRGRCDARGGVTVQTFITEFDCVRKDAFIDLKAAP